MSDVYVDVDADSGIINIRFSRGLNDYIDKSLNDDTKAIVSDRLDGLYEQLSTHYVGIAITESVIYTIKNRVYQFLSSLSDIPGWRYNVSRESIPAIYDVEND